MFVSQPLGAAPSSPSATASPVLGGSRSTPVRERDRAASDPTVVPPSLSPPGVSDPSRATDIRVGGERRTPPAGARNHGRLPWKPRQEGNALKWPNEFRGNTVLNQPTTTQRRRSLAQILSFVFGLTFLLVAVAGFIPGVTTPFEHLEVGGTDSEAELLGIFRVSVLQNIVHLLFGVGIIAAAREKWSLVYLLGGGLAYLAIAVYGFLIDQDSDANFLPINTSDKCGRPAAGTTSALRTFRTGSTR